MVSKSVSKNSAHLTIAHALFQKHSAKVENDDPSYFVFRTVRAGVYIDAKELTYLDAHDKTNRNRPLSRVSA